ncbi:phosphotransferase family protein [Nonomuraea sp. NPDC050328]|uniref:phosphotransferase family protein n=1 Tax=Nonomuraea sp. NPDC050328 TaxID=3364361 RepID=UPI0037AAFB37
MTENSGLRPERDLFLGETTVRKRFAGPGHSEAEWRALTLLAEVFAEVPARDLPVRRGSPADLLARLREWSSTPPPGPPVVREAFERALPWLAEDLPEPGEPVFGPGDGNLADVLWDGSRIRLLDFEESGRSDRAYELASIVEHLGLGGHGVRHRRLPRRVPAGGRGGRADAGLPAAAGVVLAAHAGLRRGAARPAQSAGDG